MATDSAELGAARRVADRSERLVMAAVGVGAILCAAVAFWPVRDFRAEYRRLGEAESRAIAAWRAIVTDAQTKRISDAQVADRIEREILPVWREAVRFADEIPEGTAGVPAGIAEVFRARQKAWEAMAAAGRAGDPELSREAGRKWEAANEAVARLRAAPAPANR